LSIAQHENNIKLKVFDVSLYDTKHSIRCLDLISYRTINQTV